MVVNGQRWIRMAIVEWGGTRGHSGAQMGAHGQFLDMQDKSGIRETCNRHGNVWGGDSGGLRPIDWRALVSIKKAQTKTHDILSKQNKTKQQEEIQQKHTKKILKQCLRNGKRNNKESKKKNASKRTTPSFDAKQA